MEVCGFYWSTAPAVQTVSRWAQASVCVARDTGFRNQTGQNINFSANGIAKLLKMIVDSD